MNPVLDDYERLHAALDDSELDAIARIAGHASGIGRLCYLDDATVAAFARDIPLTDGARVLDLGCGRGFLGRCLVAAGFSVEYTAMDASASALDAVRRNVAQARCVRGDLHAAQGGPYEAIFAIESLWSVEKDFAAKLYRLLTPGGCFLTTIASLGNAHAARIATSVESLTAAGFDARQLPLPADHARLVGRVCAATTLEPPSNPWVRERLVGEAYATLAALRENAFHYSVILGTRRRTSRSRGTIN